MDEDAKKNRMAQKAMLEKMRAKDFQMEAVSGDFSAWPSALVEMTEAGRASFRQKMRITAYTMPMMPNQWKVCCQVRAAARLAPKPPRAWPRYRPVIWMPTARERDFPEW